MDFVKSLKLHLQPEPVHSRSDLVVICQILDGTHSGDHGALVVDVFVAHFLDELSVNSLEFLHIKNFTLALKICELTFILASSSSAGILLP